MYRRCVTDMREERKARNFPNLRRFANVEKPQRTMYRTIKSGCRHRNLAFRTGHFREYPSS